MQRKKIIYLSIIVGVLYAFIIYFSIIFNIHIIAYPAKLTFWGDMFPLLIINVILSYFLSVKKKLGDILINFFISSIVSFIVISFVASVIYILVA